MAKLIFIISVFFRRRAGLPVIVNREGFAKILGVPSRDLAKAINSGQLVPGRHYFLINHKECFCVTNELIQEIMADCFCAGKLARQVSERSSVPATPTTRRRRVTNTEQARKAA